jgi:hypothetical protein
LADIAMIIEVRFSRVAVVLTCAAALAILLHAPFANGPKYWQWHWERIANPLVATLAFALAALPALAAHAVPRKAITVALVVISVPLLQLSAGALHGGAWIPTVLDDPSATGSFTAAEQTTAMSERRPDLELVPNYDRLLRYFTIHARTKPPGLVVASRWLLQRFDVSTAAYVFAALLIALLMLAVWMTYLAVRHLASNDAALIAATFVALASSAVLFFPVADHAYALFGALVLGWWPRIHDPRAAIAFGLTVFVFSLFSYAILAIGAFCVVTMFFKRDWLKGALIAAATIAIAYLLLQLSTGYPALATFRAALREQSKLLPILGRPYPLTIPFDLYDFAIGIGVVPLVLAIGMLIADRKHRIAVAAALTPLIIAFTGLIQAETARVWFFLVPLVAFPAALLLERVSLRQRLLVFAVMIVFTGVAFSEMKFVNLMPPGWRQRVGAPAAPR